MGSEDHEADRMVGVGGGIDGKPVLAEEGPTLAIHDLGVCPPERLPVGGVLGLKLPAEHVVEVLRHAAGLQLQEVGPPRPFLGGLELLARVQLQPL